MADLSGRVLAPTAGRSAISYAYENPLGDQPWRPAGTSRLDLAALAGGDHPTKGGTTRHCDQRTRSGCLRKLTPLPAARQSPSSPSRPSTCPPIPPLASHPPPHRRRSPSYRPPGQQRPGADTAQPRLSAVHSDSSEMPRRSRTSRSQETAPRPVEKSRMTL